MIILRENDKGLYEGKAPNVGDSVKLRTSKGTYQIGECVDIKGENYHIELKDGNEVVISLDTV